MSEFSFESCYIAYINLSHRMDRRIRMQQELAHFGIKAVRAIGLKGNEHNWPKKKTAVMKARNHGGGSIGCHASQVAVMKLALKQGKSVIVLEDDLIIADDFNERIPIIEKFINETDADLVWLSAAVHKQATWHKSINGKHTHPDLKMCDCTLNRDWEPTDNKHFVRTYGCFSTHAYIVNVKSIEKILKMLDENVHLSMGIDWLFILLQPRLKTYAFVPGCIIQYDNKSDIGDGITRYSLFKKVIGQHLFSDDMNSPTGL